MRTVAGTPRWAAIAAWAAPICVLPTARYRLALLPSDYASVDWDLIILSAGSMALAFLILGLIYGWGERLPSWVPGLGGRPVSRMAAAVAGVSIVLLVCLSALRWTLPSGFVEQGPVLIGSDQPTKPASEGGWSGVTYRWRPGVLASWRPGVLASWRPGVLASAPARGHRRLPAPPPGTRSARPVST